MWRYWYVCVQVFEVVLTKRTFFRIVVVSAF